MYNRIILYPYAWRVSAAREIVDQLDTQGLKALRVYPDRNYRPKATDLVINWGCGSPPQWRNPLNVQYKLLNSWENTRFAINKIDSFARLAACNVNTPESTTDHSKAREWYDAGKLIVGRKRITGMGGAGIILLDKEKDNWEQCPLYTLYKKKKKEFRIHVFNEKVIDFQQKKRSSSFEGEHNPLIRTHSNGWVFCRENVELPSDAGEQAIKAVKALGLTFGGVDVIWNRSENKSYVLEVNSAPGIEGTTVTKYTNAILEYLNQ